MANIFSKFQTVDEMKILNFNEYEFVSKEFLAKWVAKQSSILVEDNWNKKKRKKTAVSRNLLKCLFGNDDENHERVQFGLNEWCFLDMLKRFV